MQEEVNQNTVALSIKTAKLTGKVLAAALGKAVRALQKHHRKALTPQGRQSVKKLMNHYGGKSAMLRLLSACPLPEPAFPPTAANRYRHTGTAAWRKSPGTRAAHLETRRSRR